jgi:hypothetical protein
VLLFWAAQITSGINHTIAGALPIIAAFFVAFRIANDSTLYICIALPLIGVSIGWSIASIQQDQRSTLKRLLFTRLNPVKSPRTQKKHGL